MSTRTLPPPDTLSDNDGPILACGILSILLGCVLLIVAMRRSLRRLNASNTKCFAKAQSDDEESRPRSTSPNPQSEPARTSRTQARVAAVLRHARKYTSFVDENAEVELAHEARCETTDHAGAHTKAGEHIEPQAAAAARPTPSNAGATSDHRQPAPDVTGPAHGNLSEVKSVGIAISILMLGLLILWLGLSLMSDRTPSPTTLVNPSSGHTLTNVASSNGFAPLRHTPLDDLPRSKPPPLAASPLLPRPLLTTTHAPSTPSPPPCPPTPLPASPKHPPPVKNPLAPPPSPPQPPPYPQHPPPPSLPPPPPPPPLPPPPMHPPPPPPNPKPPPRPYSGPLNHEVCQSFWRDATHRFHELFGQSGWRRRRPGQQACWEGGYWFFEDAWAGDNCWLNWYTGSSEMPTFRGAAPALLGFDESIEDYCERHAGGGSWRLDHTKKCNRANVNILQLFGNQIPYTTCKNVEWLVCAAKGQLDGQSGRSIIFAHAPRDLQTTGIGRCDGYAPLGCRPQDAGYASLDIFYMEVCLFSQICANRDRLWSLDAEEEWQCELDRGGWEQLRQWLVFEGMPPHGTAAP